MNALEDGADEIRLLSQIMSRDAKYTSKRYQRESKEVRSKLNLLRRITNSQWFDVKPFSLTPMGFALAACGGGGEDDTVNNSTASFRIAENNVTVSVNYFTDGSERAVVRGFHPINLDGNGGQEVVIGGLESQPNTPEEYSNTSLAILSIKNGMISDVTTHYLPRGEKFIEGAGDVVFGDFNADGKLDFYTAANADMDFHTYAYAFYGTLDGFQRETIKLSIWQHGATVDDINGDGYDDVFAAGYASGASLYFGTSEGLVKYISSGDWAGGSGVALGDFLGNGRIQAVVVDNPTSVDNAADTKLFSMSVNETDGTVFFDEVSVLPTPLLEGDDFSELLANVDGKVSHDIRAEAIDFNNDGLLDVIVFSRSSFDPVASEWPRVSQVQFLENLGEGIFEDVTSIILPNYDFRSAVGYEPVIADFNGDGFIDIFISDADYGAPHSSSVFLLGDADGHFEEFGREELSEIVPANGGMATVIADEHGTYWLLVGAQSVGTDGRQENLDLYSIDFI